MSTAPLLSDALDRELGDRPAALVLDVATMTFCSAAGLTVIASSTARAAEQQVGYVVAGLAPRLARLAVEIWPASHPILSADLKAALAALAPLHALDAGAAKPMIA